MSRLNKIMKYTFDNRIFYSMKAVDDHIWGVKNDFLKVKNGLVIGTSHRLKMFIMTKTQRYGAS